MHSDHPGGDTFRSLSIAPESVICAATWIAETPTVVAARPPTDSSRERAAKPTSRASRAQTHAPSSARRVSRVRETSCVLPGWSRRPRSGCSQLNGEAEARPPQPARLLAAGCRARSGEGAPLLQRGAVARRFRRRLSGGAVSRSRCCSRGEPGVSGRRKAAARRLRRRLARAGLRIVRAMQSSRRRLRDSPVRGKGVTPPRAWGRSLSRTPRLAFAASELARTPQVA